LAILEKLEKYLMVEKLVNIVSVSIKDLDQNAYRNLKAEAIRHGMKVSEAATEAFRLWVASKRQTRQRDENRMRKGAEEMDRLRSEGEANWSGSEEIRRWRDQRKP
jgi:hypothetical protein